MRQTERYLPDLLNKLRWIIPILMSLVGVGYILLEHFVIIPGQIALVHTLRQAVLIGTLGPILAWFLLSWATSIARLRQLAEDALVRRALQLEIASEVGRRVSAILNVDDLLAQVVTLICDKFGYYHVHLFLVDDHSNKIILSECSGWADEPLRKLGLQLEIGQGITGWVAQTGQPVLCNDVSQEPRYYSLELLPVTQSELAIPLRVGQKVVGVLDVQSERRDAFQEDDLTTLQILADQIAIAIENADLFQKTRRQVAVMQALHDISLEITSRLDSHRVLAIVIEQATTLLNAQGGSVGVYDPETKLINILAHSNANFQSILMRVGEGAAGRVIATGKPQVINDLRHWKGRSPVYKDSAYNAILTVPLIWREEVFGTLSVLASVDRRPFTDDDVELMSLFADLVSIALKKAELFSQVVQLSQNLEHKVEQRTDQLVKAREALAQKAQQLQRLLGNTVRVQEDERTRIARDLHDGLNQLITAILFELQAAQECILGERTDDALAKMTVAKKLLRTIEAENRRIIYGLRPPVLDTQGLVPALKWYVTTLPEYYNIVGSVQVMGDPVRLSADTETTIYRIVQESLNNVAAHAQAQSAQIHIDFNQTNLQIIIQDDGIGFDDEYLLTAVPGQMGLIGMQERAQSIAGKVDVRSVPGQGTWVTLDIPLSTETMPNVLVSEH